MGGVLVVAPCLEIPYPPTLLLHGIIIYSPDAFPTLCYPCFAELSRLLSQQLEYMSHATWISNDERTCPLGPWKLGLELKATGAPRPRRTLKVQAPVRVLDYEPNAKTSHGLSKLHLNPLIMVES
jgi:hypothetical protein